jgi:hypothetical protein
MGYRLDGQGSISGETRDYSLLRSVKTSSGKLVSYAMGTGGSFSVAKTACG